jgi:hypothetical protein
MDASSSLDSGPSNWLLRSFSDDLHEENPGDALNRGLATKVAVDRHRERQSIALQDQRNPFLLKAREMAVESVVIHKVFMRTRTLTLLKPRSRRRDPVEPESEALRRVDQVLPAVARGTATGNG